MMALGKRKTPNAGRAEGFFKVNCTSIVAYLGEAIKAKHEQASIAIWRASYALEEARQTHAALGHLWRQAGCCVALSLIGFLGGRY